MAVYNILNKFDNIEYSKKDVDNFLRQKVNKTKINFFPDYDQWPSYWKEQFWQIAGDTMEKFGYTD